MSDDFKTKQRILDELRKVANENKIPRRLHIPKVFEVEMCLLSDAEVGSALARDILVHGPRKAIRDQGGTLFGMEVVWDATEFKIETAE